VCHFEVKMPDQFWAYQVKSIANAKEAFAGRQDSEVRAVIEGLEGLSPAVAQLSQDPGNRRAAKTLQTKIDRLSQQLIP
jgi:hypothetical protein